MILRRKILTLSLLTAMTAGAPALAEEKFKAITTFTVIADMAVNVAGDAAEVVSITKPGAEIHGYQPTPRDLIRAQDADLILWNGMNLELWFEQFFGHLNDVPQAVLTEGITPIDIREGDYIGRPNPHAWMSLNNALIYVDNIAAAFAEHDADNADIYFDNALAYKAKLKAEIAPLRDEILSIPEKDRWLVSCEGAFSYLAQDYGMKELYLWPINADQTGTPQQVRKVVDEVRANDIKVIFCESTVNNDPAKQVARETGGQYGGVLYVDSLTKENGAVPTFIDMLRVTSETIATGLRESLNE